MQSALFMSRRTKLAFAALGLMLAMALSVASPPQAHAAGCVTLGHAYYIKLPSGFNYMSGFEGDKRYGIPLVEVRRGEPFQLGGNGIKPGTAIRFYNNSGIMDPFNGASSFFTSFAGSNCVVDQTKNNGFIGNVPNGTYRVRADYQVPSRSITGDPVVDLKVVG
jgi:hypothetical protein